MPASRFPIATSKEATTGMNQGFARRGKEAALLYVRMSKLTVDRCNCLRCSLTKKVKRVLKAASNDPLCSGTNTWTAIRH